MALASGARAVLAGPLHRRNPVRSAALRGKCRRATRAPCHTLPRSSGLGSCDVFSPCSRARRSRSARWPYAPPAAATVLTGPPARRRRWPRAPLRRRQRRRPPRRRSRPLGGAWSERLPVAGFGDATVSVPLGATSPRPVLLGVEGRGDRPEWACGEWRGVTNAYPFILCPHGVPANAGPNVGLSFADPQRTLREIDAGLSALRARFGRYVARGPMIYAGFSQGAFLGRTIATHDPARFPVAVLAEGGQTTWTADLAARFLRGGGKRLLFVCSTAACEAATPPALAKMRRCKSGVTETQLGSASAIGLRVEQALLAMQREAADAAPDHIEPARIEAGLRWENIVVRVPTGSRGHPDAG